MQTGQLRIAVYGFIGGVAGATCPMWLLVGQLGGVKLSTAVFTGLALIVIGALWGTVCTAVPAALCEFVCSRLEGGRGVVKAVVPLVVGVAGPVGMAASALLGADGGIVLFGIPGFWVVTTLGWALLCLDRLSVTVSVAVLSVVYALSFPGCLVGMVMGLWVLVGMPSA